MVDGSLFSTLFAAVIGGALSMTMPMLWWRTPRSHRGIVAVAIIGLSGIVLLLAASAGVRLGAMLIWVLAPVFAMLCWRIERVGAEVRSVHGFLATASVLPGVLLAIRAMPSAEPSDPSLWWSVHSTNALRTLALGHLLATLLPTVSLVLQASQREQARRARSLALSVAAALGGGGMAWAGLQLSTSPDLVRVVFATTAPIVAGLIAWSVVRSVEWNASTETYMPAVTAVSMTRIVSNTTARLGRELALAHAHARSLLSTPDLQKLPAAEELIQTLERGQELAGALSRNADGEAHHRAVIELEELISRVLLYATSGRRDVANLSQAAPRARVWMNSSTLERALLALVRNALQAQDSVGSTATIEVRTIASTQVHLASNIIAGSLEHEQYVVVEVVDQGDGLDESTRAHCLEPFFSTRDGLDGLGLFAVLTLVRTEEAAFELSTSDGSTRAALWLPIHQKAMAESTRAWSWQQLGMVIDQRDVIVVDQNARRMEKFGLLMHARGWGWGSVQDLQGLISGQLGPRADGVVLVMGELTGREATLLARWMAPRLAHVVAQPAAIAALIARGMSAEETLAFQSEQAHAVLSAVETALMADPSSSR